MKGGIFTATAAAVEGTGEDITVSVGLIHVKWLTNVAAKTVASRSSFICVFSNAASQEPNIQI